MTAGGAGEHERVAGSPEAGGEDSGHGVPNPQTGVGLGAGAGSSFEPEEEAAPDDAAPEDAR